MALREIPLYLSEAQSLPDQVSEWIANSRQRIELYWDSFSKEPLPQYIECDFDLVALALARGGRA
jgi:hypothetical protein